jgi:hypothetical protein
MYWCSINLNATVSVVAVLVHIGRVVAAGTTRCCRQHRHADINDVIDINFSAEVGISVGGGVGVRDRVRGRVRGSVAGCDGQFSPQCQPVQSPVLGKGLQCLDASYSANR